MVKVKEHSEDVMKRVVAVHVNGENYRKICERLDIPISPVRAIIRSIPQKVKSSTSKDVEVEHREHL